MGGRTISNLSYADDIVLLATSPEELQELRSLAAVLSQYTFWTDRPTDRPTDGIGDRSVRRVLALYW